MRASFAVAFILLATSAAADYREFEQITVDPGLESRVRRAAELSLAQFPKLKAEDLAISVVDLTNAVLSRADIRGDERFYPASVIKIFFMADVYLQKRENLRDMDRALEAMIVESDNDATAFIVDVLADTSGVTSLEGRALRRYIDKRRQINRRFARLGYDISAMMKPWSFGPYGRERQVLGDNKVNRNRLTANGTAALMLWIARRRAPSSEAMLSFLARPLNPPREDENQIKDFIGAALPPEAKLWSKAGWTSEVRHDAAYVELPGGRKLVVVIFTRGQASDVTLIPAIARLLFAELAS
jgi:beta-lactamase class A